MQNAVSDEIFPKISYEETAKTTWEVLQEEFRGDPKVRSVKLKSIRRDFEYTRMKDDELLKDYFTRLSDVMNQMKSYGEDLPSRKVVQKILISLTPKYDPIVSVLIETKDMETTGIQDIIGSIKAFDQRLDRHAENATECISNSCHRFKR
ncbi:uncharacterized protein LOC133716406 [Rosa rugosa]|uniref:uncharacterized protein LOC133716406 n=1 Tax=Rosa rugosa TaxID=74645 RepID=UPI002B4162FD|nr:uncharacterized protein LOC133716406 [Rosa rugosa]